MKARNTVLTLLIFGVGLISCNEFNKTGSTEDNLVFPKVLAGNKSVEGAKLIPNSLIEKIKRFNGEDSLLNEINRLAFQIIRDSMFNKDHTFGVLSPFFVDLDGDMKNEIICLFGIWHENPTLGLFKEDNKNWKCLFFEDFHHHYEGVNVSIVNNPGKEKVVLVKELEARGSGLYKEVSHFFKLIDEQFIHCLRIVSDSRINGWGLYLNQEIYSDFSFSNYNGSDKIWVRYKFRYYPGPIFEKDVSWTSHPEINIIQGTEGVGYIWNQEAKKYEPEFSSKDDVEIIKKRLIAFDEFGNDTIIVEAFKEEFELELRKGSTQQKEIIEKYIKLVEQDRKASVPSGELEQVGETEGGMKFYKVNKKTQ